MLVSEVLWDPYFIMTCVLQTASAALYAAGCLSCLVCCRLHQLPWVLQVWSSAEKAGEIMQQVMQADTGLTAIGSHDLSSLSPKQEEALIVTEEVAAEEEVVTAATVVMAEEVAAEEEAVMAETAAVVEEVAAEEEAVMVELDTETKLVRKQELRADQTSAAALPRAASAVITPPVDVLAAASKETFAERAAREAIEAAATAKKASRVRKAARRGAHSMDISC